VRVVARVAVLAGFLVVVFVARGLAGVLTSVLS